nr:MAG TPA: hypothetical protein [Caudoviricetes sp.]
MGFYIQTQKPIYFLFPGIWKDRKKQNERLRKKRG